MVKAQSNIILKILAVFVIAVIAVVFLMGRSTPSMVTVRGNSDVNLTPIDGISLEEEGDTANETLKTVIYNQKEMKELNDRLQRENQEKQAKIDELLRMEENIKSRLEKQYEEKSDVIKKEANDSKDLLESVAEKVESLMHAQGLAARPESDTDAIPSSPASNPNNPNSDIPVGFGLDGNLPAHLVGMPSANGNKAALSKPEEYVWEMPDDLPIPDEKGNYVFPEPVSDEFTQHDENTHDDIDAVLTGEKNSKEKKKADPIAVYTIPENATLVGSVGMTSLVGKVPVGDAVKDPFPFKAIIGQENLAANGIYIPGISSMVVRGMAVGDWTLSCVRGTVQSATFVFRDGTIRTVSAATSSLGAGAGAGLGWISDERGIPCVTGERITNAVSFLSQRIGLAAASVYAQARATAATQSSQNDQGAVVTQVLDPSTYAMNSAISGGLNETSDWLKERQSSSFDIIYVPPGESLVFHIDQEMAIDYEPDGRKVFHSENYGKVNHAQLD